MRGMISALKTIGVTSMTLALVSAAQASTTRTFVSNAGTDSASCGVVTSPCKTLLGAYNNTIAGGEIVIMNPGGYGPLTITHALSIIGASGTTLTASASGPIGITINAGASDKIRIRDLEITGANVAGTTGIQLISGQLMLRDVGLKMLGTGLQVGNNTGTTAHADVINSDIFGNTIAIATDGAGVPASCPFSCIYSGPGQTEVRINGGNFNDNATAFDVQNPGQTSNNGNATIFIAQPGTNYSLNLTGFTTYLSVSGTGSHASTPSVTDAPVVTYSVNGAPN